ncbi:MAG: hypothetical protein U9N53_11035, partial [Bacteroidota bacterium]|nr:hypothetical protein [Bacteroidota bacterium]
DEYKINFTYNLKGLLKKEINRNIKVPADITTCTYKYDKSNNLIEVIESEIDETYIEKHIYKHGNRGLKIDEKVYYNDDLAKRYWYTYNIEGRLIETHYEDYSSDSKDYTLIRYDNKGNTMSYASYKDNEKISEFSYVYDNKNNLIMEEYESRGVKTSKNESNYTFDSKGNWITLDHYTNGKFNFSQRRNIEYYN